MLWLLLAAAGATAASIAVPLVARRIVDGPLRHQDPNSLPLLGGLAFAFGLVEVALVFIRRWTHAATALDLESTLRCDIFSHLQRLPLSFHDRWPTGQLLSRAMGDLVILRRFLSFGIIFGLVDIVTYLTVGCLLLRLYWPLGLLVAMSAVPLFLIRRHYSAEYLASARSSQEQRGSLTTFVAESVTGIRAIRSFGRHDHFAERFSRQARRLHDTGVAKSRLLAASWSQFELIPDLTLAVVLIVGAVEVARGRLSLGGLVAFVALQTMLVYPVKSLGWIVALGQEAIVAADRVYDVLDATPAVVDRPTAVHLSRAASVGRVRFENVGFRYPGAQRVLHQVNLDLAPGETLALVGATGCGKTTLLSLVPRLYDVTEGRITLDGRDLREHSLRSLRSIVTVAFEDPSLFSMSVRDNLTLGHPNASEAELADALTITQATFVYGLKRGLHTRIGERGLTLSGGQRQRLALARAVLSRPRVLVLDDPLSALDLSTGARVEAAIAEFLGGSTTTLVVARRPATVANADRVALLAGGTITAVGGHQELLTTQPSYAELFSGTAEDLAAR